MTRFLQDCFGGKREEGLVRAFKDSRIEEGSATLASRLLLRPVTSFFVRVDPISDLKSFDNPKRSFWRELKFSRQVFRSQVLRQPTCLLGSQDEEEVQVS